MKIPGTIELLSLIGVLHSKSDQGQLALQAVARHLGVRLINENEITIGLDLDSPPR